MESKIMNRLRGYDRHFRGRFLLLHNQVLTDQESILWDLSYSCLADWDKNHGETYGSFEYDWGEIGSLLSWSGSKVGRNSKKLFLLGFWRRQHKRIYVAGFDLRDHFAQITKEERVIDLQRELTKMQLSDANPLSQGADLQNRIPKGNGQFQDQNCAVLHEDCPKEPLSSFKCGCNVRNGRRSNEEYQTMLEKDPDSLDIKTMQEMDESIWESTGVCVHGEKLYAKTTY